MSKKELTREVTRLVGFSTHIRKEALVYISGMMRMPVSLKTEQIIRLEILQRWQTEGMPSKVAPTLLLCFPCKHEDLGSTPSTHVRCSHAHIHL